MLHNRIKKYRMLTLITIGIAILGLITAMIANLAFSEGLIGFCLAVVCVVASAICQIIFARMEMSFVPYYNPDLYRIIEFSDSERIKCPLRSSREKRMAMDLKH